MNPSGVYALICNGEPGTLQLTVDVDGDLINSKLHLWGKTDPISGHFNEIDGLLEFKVESSEYPNLRFKGYVMTLTGDKSAFAGTGSDYVPSSGPINPSRK